MTAAELITGLETLGRALERTRAESKATGDAYRALLDYEKAARPIRELAEYWTGYAISLAVTTATLAFLSGAYTLLVITAAAVVFLVCLRGWRLYRLDTLKVRYGAIVEASIGGAA